MFIKLTNYFNRENIFINIQHIESMSRRKGDDKTEISTLTSKIDRYFLVIETPEEIIKMIEEMEK